VNIIIIVVHGKLAGPAAVPSTLLMLTSRRHHRHRRCARSHGRLRAFRLNKTFYECLRETVYNHADGILKRVEKQKKNVILIPDFIITRFPSRNNYSSESKPCEWLSMKPFWTFFYFFSKILCTAFTLEPVNRVTEDRVQLLFFTLNGWERKDFYYLAFVSQICRPQFMFSCLPSYYFIIYTQ